MTHWMTHWMITLVAGATQPHADGRPSIDLLRCATELGLGERRRCAQSSLTLTWLCGLHMVTQSIVDMCRQEAACSQVLECFLVYGALLRMGPGVCLLSSCCPAKVLPGSPRAACKA